VGYTTFATIACKALQEYKTRTDADLGKLNEQIHERDTKIEALEAKLAEQEAKVAAQDKRSTAQADEVTSQNARLVALEKLINKSSPPETVSIKLGEQ
jgi:septal ring factor EnvC (AmiA/AmiB activator)